MTSVRMTNEQVRRLFKDAGELSYELAAKDFVVLKTHKKILQDIESDFQFGMSVRILSGQIGEGKTWTLSWLWRQMATKKSPRTYVAVPQDWTLGTAPAASLVAGLFSFVLTHPRGDFDSIAAADPPNQKAARVLAHLQDEEASHVLAEGTGRMPAIEGFRSFSFKNPRHLFDMFEGLAALVRAAGYDRILILADEAEGPLLHAAKRSKLEMANFLRHLIDRHQADDQLGLPIQLILAGTTDVIRAWTGRIAEVRSGNPTMEALKRRLSNPLYLEPPSLSELHKIAEVRIRNALDTEPYIPFAPEAIDAAWSHSFSQLGTFLRILRVAYQEALAEKASEILPEHVQMVVEAGEILDQP